ncbi:3-deoxy-D-manno-octulosonic acid transferase [Ovoidimarina sediminis]|uniref:3-deoxy-D-manno-octulosonic acid transferase n=1 Tax=Ovoidimarina sediminis TaxID=3079856 RepID=UPI0029124C10|nr:3-deoxy-D-manno-octulosonic acid transferase [Rhodophyticola sp. MJ-SS7]MDU8944844.1 3-deoxy-D-manno-octulosonic acid transferase [Rhodophyticola sp. MJ-SS7]
MTSPDPGSVYRVYSVLAGLLEAPIRSRDATKLREAGVSADRLGERNGIAAAKRPSGPLAWVHAVSVGESLSVLGLIGDLARARSDVSFLITTTSATSARMVADRLPPRSWHQFAPLDTPGAVSRFLDHWRPDLAVFVESELWPRQIVEAHRRGTRLALVNARLSSRSLRRWRRLPNLAAALLSRFEAITTQTSETAEALVALGADADRVTATGDLKSAADPLPVDDEELAGMMQVLADRLLWIAASTHPGEEEQVLDARPRGRLLILVPRHPERGDALAEMMRGRGLTVAQRSKGEPVEPETDVYLADTLGEMGLWYSLAPLAFLGGSLMPIGGHNPFEPAQFGVPVIFGPGATNFAETNARMVAAGGAVEVPDATGLAAALDVLGRPDDLMALQAGARRFAEAQGDVRRVVAERLLPLLAP